MTRFTAIFSAVILAFLQGCQKDTSVSQTFPTTTETFKYGVSKWSDPFPGFEVVNSNTKDIYGCVGHVHNRQGEFIGSGVLIAPAVVLTAAHVIEGEDLVYFITRDRAYKIEKTIKHPDWNPRFLDHDLGILLLQDPCLETPATIIGSKAELRRREALTTVGWSKQIKKISKPGTFWYYGTLEEFPGFMKFLPHNGNIWIGDSGGAVFEDGGKLAGIISSLTIIDYQIIDQSAVRLDLYLDWIESTIKSEHCTK